MYVYEEIVDGVKLTEIINTKHENTKYLPGCILPHNVVGILCLLNVFQQNEDTSYFDAYLLVIAWDNMHDVLP